MRASRRRTRRHDLLASPEAVRRVLVRLRRQCPVTLPSSDLQLIRMLESVRHYERRHNIDESRGRPRRWPREDVAVVAKKLKTLLARETNGRISHSSFVSLYLPILRYPADVAAALSECNINIREAAYLARLTPERLKCSTREAQQVRRGIINAHLLTNGSQSSLRMRVKVALGEIHEVARSGELGRQKADALLRQNPYDARHLFYEGIQQLVEVMGQIEPEEIKSKALGEVLRQVDKLQNTLLRIKHGKHR